MEQKRRLKHNGFSLIELVAATTIIAMIFGGISALRGSQVEYFRKTQSERDTAAVLEALSCYLYFHGEEPEGLKDITIDKLIRKGFLIGENKSPWGVPYKLSVKDSSILVEPAIDTN